MAEIRTPLFKVFQPEGVDVALRDTLYSGFIAEGPKTAAFTRAIGDFIGNPRTVAVNSCTTALAIAFRLAGVGPGREVISTPLTCIASNEPIVQLGGTIMWADVDPRTGMITADTIAPHITSRTAAICVLHKEGDPARLGEILALARRHGIKVVEDAAHTFGARYDGAPIGSQGDYACFSFQAIKHITTGDGGALACGDEADYLRARKLKWFGVDREARPPRNTVLNEVPDVVEWGFKGNMNDLAATIGLEQMKHVDAILQAFHANGIEYSRLLAAVPGIEILARSPRDFGTYWGYCLLAEGREGLVRKLAEHGVSSGQIHERNDRYSMFREFRAALPGVDHFDARELSLPCGWWVTVEERERIVDVIRKGW
ncbi:MAG: DegT/DnrJ/EryC1/StrS family aminotransferase [Candidatus Rokubacteria bacterium]|nr:DegT/DnrJ/EryC1/StrS family aminotransferase [Candidatus Rokubacteria bacterium]